MKLTLTLCLLMSFIPSSLFGKASELLKCLGREEYRLHKNKIRGPIYNLNQTFINELSMIPNIVLDAQKRTQVCHSREYGPSVSLLRLMLTKGRQFFHLEKTASGQSLGKKQLDDLLSRSPHIFFKYLNQIEAGLPHAHCLIQSIPEVQYFYDRYKFLEAEISSTNLISEKDKIKKIFAKLKNLDQIAKKCQREVPLP